MEIDDIDDAFDKIVFAEEKFQQEGFAVGVKQGKLSGYHDGYNTGAMQGAKLGSEMGFYEGWTLAWKQHLEREPDKNKRKLKALNGLLEAVHHITNDHPSDSHLHEHVDAARAKFKQVSSLISISPVDVKPESLSF